MRRGGQANNAGAAHGDAVNDAAPAGAGAGAVGANPGNAGVGADGVGNFGRGPRVNVDGEHSGSTPLLLFTTTYVRRCIGACTF